MVSAGRDRRLQRYSRMRMRGVGLDVRHRPQIWRARGSAGKAAVAVAAKHEQLAFPVRARGLHEARVAEQEVEVPVAVHVEHALPGRSAGQIARAELAHRPIALQRRRPGAHLSRAENPRALVHMHAQDVVPELHLRQVAAPGINARHAVALAADAKHHAESPSYAANARLDRIRHRAHQAVKTVARVAADLEREALNVGRYIFHPVGDIAAFVSCDFGALCNLACPGRYFLAAGCYRRTAVPSDERIQIAADRAAGSVHAGKGIGRHAQGGAPRCEHTVVVWTVFAHLEVERGDQVRPAVAIDVHEVKTLVVGRHAALIGRRRRSRPSRELVRQAAVLLRIERTRGHARNSVGPGHGRKAQPRLGVEGAVAAVAAPEKAAARGGGRRAQRSVLPSPSRSMSIMSTVG